MEWKQQGRQYKSTSSALYTDTRISVNSLPTQQNTQKNGSAVQEIQEIKLKARGKSNPSWHLATRHKKTSPKLRSLL